MNIDGNGNRLAKHRRIAILGKQSVGKTSFGRILRDASLPFLEKHYPSQHAEFKKDFRIGKQFDLFLPWTLFDTFLSKNLSSYIGRSRESGEWKRGDYFRFQQHMYRKRRETQTRPTWSWPIDY